MSSRCSASSSACSSRATEPPRSSGYSAAPGTAAPYPLYTWPGWYAAVIQLIGGILVALGLGTRVAALISSGSMAYAYFTVHQSHALLPLQNGGEPSAVFCWVFLLIVFTGPGALALDGLLTARTPDRQDRDRAAERNSPVSV